MNKRRSRLLTVVLLSAAIVIADIIALNVVGEVTEFWWFLAVPVGLFLVSAIGLVALVLLLKARRGA